MAGAFFIGLLVNRTLMCIDRIPSTIGIHHDVMLTQKKAEGSMTTSFRATYVLITSHME